jgi:Zn-dependent membrane protease YugP
VLPILLIVVVIALLALLPQIYVQRVIKQHSTPRTDFPGTGGEFARHLLDRAGLQSVRVEGTDLGDHYDPEDKAVRLSHGHMGGSSLAAVVIAAHEVGHAIQDAIGYKPLQARTRLAKQAVQLERLGAILMLVAPIVMVLSKSPHILILEMVAGFLIMSLSVVAHLVTLPTEFDASFRRALPILKDGNYIKPEDMRSARQILWAAALTYVAAAAMTLLNVGRWLRTIRI